MNSQMHYLPLTTPFFAVLVVLFGILVVVLQVRAFRFAYGRLGISPNVAMLILLASLIGSYFNIPITELPQQQVASDEVVDYFGMQYRIPVVQNWPGTVIAVNVGGAIIPGLTSLYLLITRRLWLTGAIATACVAAICHMLAEPVAGLGIALPTFAPAIATAVVAILLSHRDAAPLAYIGGSLGTLVGADLLNLDEIQGLGAPVASIGGAGTFDGIFVTGVLAVLLASLADV
jgi:uncharacterized membrane protein